MRPCPKCTRPMTALFTSLVCDWCDGLKQPAAIDRGFVVWQPGSGPRELYVFPTREMAEYYQIAASAQGEIREVLSETRFTWRRGSGTIPNLKLADHLYTVYSDHRFEPGAYRAFLAPRTAGRIAA